jgi:hypothetical protein
MIWNTFENFGVKKVPLTKATPTPEVTDTQE